MLTDLLCLPYTARGAPVTWSTKNVNKGGLDFDWMLGGGGVITE